MPDPPTDARPGVSFPLDRVFRDLLECVPEGVVAADLEGRLVVFNTGAQRIFGMGPGDVPSDRLDYTSRLLPRRCGDAVPAGATAPLHGDPRRNGEGLPGSHPERQGAGRHLDQRQRHPAARRAPATLYGGVAVFRDVTDERRKLERMRLLSAVAEQTADAVIVTDRHGVIEYVNPAVEKMSGFAPDELIGKTPRVLRSGLHTSADYAAMWATLLKGEVFRGTLVNRKKASGEIYYSEQTITPIQDSSGRVSRFVSVAKDLTEVRVALDRESKLRLARSVQQRMYPDPPPPSCGFDVAGTAIPADETGGDYFDYLRLPGGGLALAVGDVSGHGIDAALHMVQARTMLRAVVQAQSNPGAVLARMNGMLVQELDDHRFMTLVLACLHARLAHAALRQRRPHLRVPGRSGRRREGRTAQHGDSARGDARGGLRDRRRARPRGRRPRRSVHGRRRREHRRRRLLRTRGRPRGTPAPPSPAGGGDRPACLRRRTDVRARPPGR